MHFTRDTLLLFNQHFEGSVSVAYKVQFPDTYTTEIEFVGLVTELTVKSEMAGLVTANVTIKITGKADFDWESTGA